MILRIYRQDIYNGASVILFTSLGIQAEVRIVAIALGFEFSMNNIFVPVEDRVSLLILSSIQVF